MLPKIDENVKTVKDVQIAYPPHEKLVFEGPRVTKPLPKVSWTVPRIRMVAPRIPLCARYPKALPGFSNSAKAFEKIAGLSLV